MKDDFRDLRDRFDSRPRKAIKSISKDFKLNDLDTLLKGNRNVKTLTDRDDQLLLPSGKLITFNAEQYEGIKKIRAWIKKEDDNFFTLAGYAGTGKAQPLYSKLYTPDGYITMGDVKVGDLVIGSNGKPTKVLDVFPQGIKPMYRVTFSDGFHVDCCEDHLWKVKTFNDRNRQRSFIYKFKKHKEYYSILSTKDMVDNVYYIRNDETIQFNYKIQVNSAVEFKRKETPIDPYLLGVLIGDGGLTQSSVRFTSADKEIIDRVTTIVSLLYHDLTVKQVSNTIGYSISGDVGKRKKNELLKELRQLKLTVRSEKKHIPEIYKYSSIIDRISLLQGLMDTDGTVDKNGHYISYATVSPKLANDICELAQSLGCVTKINYKPNNHQGCYIISINQTNDFDVFSLSRKQNLVVDKSKYKTPRYISKIEYVKDIEQQCIRVDAEDNLYLTNNFTVTHNSTCVKKILDEYNWGVVVSAPTHKAKKVIINLTGEDGLTLHALCGLRPDVNLDEFNPNSPIFNPIAIPKICDYNLVIIDEASMINKELFELIKQLTLGSRTKVLFMGDPAQIPPIGEKESVVFTQSDIEIHWLTKIERQNDTNPLAYVYDALRNNLDRLDGGFLRKSVMNDLGEGVIFTVNKMKFRTALLEKFRSDEFKKDTDFVKVIAWKNETVMASNKVIRTELLGADKKDVIEVGDVLMAYRSVSSDNQRYNIIENSADYRVMEKGNLEQNHYEIKGYMVKLRENLSHGRFKFVDVFIIDSNDHENLHQYAEVHDYFRDMGMSNKKMWNKYYEFRRHNILMVTIEKFRNGMLRNSSEVIKKDLDYGYAITGHKCLSENSKIQRLDGFVSLKDIQIGDIVINGGMNCNKVLDKIYTGKKRAFKLMTSFGYEIICSEDHRILNKHNEFQPLKEFNVGDYIPINRKTYVENMNITQRDINYYLGLLIADGSYSGNRKRDKYRIDLTIGFDDPDNIEFIKQFYTENDINFGEYYRPNGRMVNIYVSNKAWREKLFNLGLKYVKGNDKSIPESIIIGTLQQKSNFIAGLFDGDGSIKGSGRLRFVNNSIILIKEVQNILLEFGIISYYSKHKKAYTLTVLGTSMPDYKKYISFRLNRKVKLLNDYHYTIKTNRDNIPFRNEILNIVRQDLVRKNTWQTKNTGIYPESFRKFPIYAQYLSYWHLENIFKLYEINNKLINQFLTNIYNNHYFYDKIIEIIEVDEEEMYDLEIENIHQFISDGFIVHNSQGSTYTHVFVMENDINENWVLKERNQIKYVALTRPTTSAMVLTTKIDV